MATMKALVFEKYGPPTVLAVQDRPRPDPKQGEVLIEVRASAINPSDLKNVAGQFNASLPRVPGRDYAGVVIGGDGERGQEVWGSGPGFGVVRDGAHAEYVIAAADSLSAKPSSLSMEEAATVGVSYLVAWWGLIDAGALREGETLLIVGAGGAVGRAATQIARWKKARIIGADVREASGVDAFVNTNEKDLPAEIADLTGRKGADIVFDAVGGPMFEPALKSLRLGGRQVAITSARDPRVSFNLVDFYHNLSRLIGIDTMKLEGPQVADI
ncbi:MAG: zinc-binding alcohol dehydrogenase family protein, partial [Acetobacteraceae bacterium]|nr:zinc-binding alcohol dehydrogenase family protein [Acetobacteraceae bacterium]